MTALPIFMENGHNSGTNKYTDGGYSYKNFHTTCTGEKWTSTFYDGDGEWRWGRNI